MGNVLLCATFIFRTGVARAISFGFRPVLDPLRARSVPRSFRETEMRNWTQLLSIIETGIHDRLQPLAVTFRNKMIPQN